MAEIKEAAKQHDVSFEELRKLFQDIAERQKETDRQMKDTAAQMKETDRKPALS